MSTAGFNFKKDGRSDDGHEMNRFLTANHTVAELPTGSYRLGTERCAPGSLGVLPAGTTYRDNGDGTITLTVG